jgi:hypothetical protein
MAAAEVGHQHQDKLPLATPAVLGVVALDLALLAALETRLQHRRHRAITVAAVLLMGLFMALVGVAALVLLVVLDKVMLAALAGLVALHQLAGVLSLMLLVLVVGFMRAQQPMAQAERRTPEMVAAAVNAKIQERQQVETAVLAS